MGICLNDRRRRRPASTRTTANGPKTRERRLLPPDQAAGANNARLIIPATAGCGRRDTRASASHRDRPAPCRVSPRQRPPVERQAPALRPSSSGPASSAWRSQRHDRISLDWVTAAFLPPSLRPKQLPVAVCASNLSQRPLRQSRGKSAEAGCGPPSSSNWR